MPHKKSEELPLAGLCEVFTGLWLFTPTFGITGYDYVKCFVRVLVLLVSQKTAKKWGTLHC